MTGFKQADLEALAQVEGYPCISIYLPTHRRGSETRQDPIRLKNALKAVGQTLETQGLAASDVEQYLRPGEELVEQFEFWQHQAAGLALFIADGFFRLERLPFGVREFNLVGDRFYTAPLMPLLADDSPFYLLALSQNAVRLFEGSHYSMAELPLPDSPHSLAEALRYDEVEPQLQLHSVQGKTAIYHGQGGDGDESDGDILRFFHQLNRGVMAQIAAQTKPLLLAGVDFLIPLYEQANQYPHLITEPHLGGNPEQRSMAELHCHAWEALSPRLHQARTAALEAFYAALTASRASDDLKTVVLAAAKGQVDTLFAAPQEPVWGQFEPQTMAVTVHGAYQRGDRDLLDFAMQEMLINRGQLYLLEVDEMPNRVRLAATLRYPITQ